MKKKVLILGGSGFIGRNLIKKLKIKKNLNITCVFRSNIINKERYKNVNYIKCDLTKLSNFKKFENKEFDYIINLSGNINHEDKVTTKKIHNLAVKNIFRFFIKKKIKLFIQAGSSLEYGNLSSPQEENFKCSPNSTYGKSKLSSTKFIEKYAKKNKVNYLIFRLYQVYGPFQKLNRLIPFTVDNCIKNKTFNCSAGKQYRDFLYVDDLINLFELSIDKPKIKSGIYNVGSGLPIKVKSVITLINKIIKKGTPNFGAIKMRSDEIEILFPNINKTIKTFKWRPKITLINGLKKTIKYYEKKR